MKTPVLGREEPQARAWQSRSGAALAVIATLAGLYVLYFWQLGVLPLVPANEGLYAEIAREMNESGDYITPHANHLRYYEKPPLLYWCTAAAFKLLGESEASARLTSALAGIGTAFATFLIGRLLWGSSFGLLSAVVCGSSVGMIGMCRMVMFDATLTVWTSVAFLGFVIGYFAPRKRWGYLLCAAALGLGLMTKGAIALAITLPALAIIITLTRGWGRWREMMLWQSAALFLLIVAPWHIAISLRDPNFVWFYFVNETLQRFMGTRVPADYHRGPLTFYIPRNLALFAPWSLLLPAAILAWPRRPRPSQSQPDNDSQASANVYLLGMAWLIWPFILFSVSSNKANYYLLPTFPAQALLIVRVLRMSRTGGQAQGRWLRGLIAASFVLVALGAGYGLMKAETDPHPIIISLDPVARAQVYWSLRATVALWVAGALAGLFLRPRTKAVWLLALSAVTLTLGLGQIARQRWYEFGAKRAVQIAIQYAGDNHEILLDRSYELQSTAAFYLHRRMRCIDGCWGDLWYGSTLEPSDEWFPTSASVFARIERGEKLVILADVPDRINSWLDGGKGRIVDRGDFGGSQVLTANF